MGSKLFNKNELAEILKKEERTLTRWQEEGMPIAKPAARRGQEHQYDLASVVEWIIAREVKKKIGKSADEKTETKTRFDQIRLEREEIELSRLKGEVLAYEEVQQAWSMIVVRFRTKLLSLPNRFANQLVGLKPNQIEERARKAIHEVLNDLATDSVDAENAGADQSSDAAGRTAAKPKRKRVGKPKKVSKQRVKRGAR